MNKSDDEKYLDLIRSEASAQISAFKKLRQTPIGAKHAPEIMQRAKIAASAGGLFTRLRATLTNDRAIDVMIKRMALLPGGPDGTETDESGTQKGGL